MTYETMNMKWRDIDFTLAYNAYHFPSANIAHAEVHCDKPLPITETGYKSMFMANTDIADIKVLAALILQEMDRTATRTNWQQEVQLSLF